MNNYAVTAIEEGISKRVSKVRQFYKYLSWTGTSLQCLLQECEILEFLPIGSFRNAFTAGLKKSYFLD